MRSPVGAPHYPLLHLTSASPPPPPPPPPLRPGSRRRRRAPPPGPRARRRRTLARRGRRRRRARAAAGGGGAQVSQFVGCGFAFPAHISQRGSHQVLVIDGAREDEPSEDADGRRHQHQPSAAGARFGGDVSSEEHKARRRPGRAYLGQARGAGRPQPERRLPGALRSRAGHSAEGARYEVGRAGKCEQGAAATSANLSYLLWRTRRRL